MVEFLCLLLRTVKIKTPHQDVFDVSSFYNKVYKNKSCPTTKEVHDSIRDESPLDSLQDTNIQQSIIAVMTKHPLKITLH